MKKAARLSLVLLVLTLLTAAMAMGVSAEAELPQQCSHCGKDVTWLPLSEVTETTIPAGHYYVDQATVTVTNKTVAKSTSVCIYMNGNTIDAGEVNRVFYVAGTLTVMGEGTVKGYGRNKSMTSTSDRYGGTIHIPSSGTFNLYDATVTSEKLEDSKASNGGNVCVYGTFNMYSGALNNGYASNSGGNIFVAPAGTFYMSGGQITGGTTGGVGASVCTQGKVILAGDGSINDLFLWDKSEAGFDTLLTVQGAYTGSSYIQLRKGSSKQTPAADMVVGTSDNANLRQAKLNFAGSGLYTKVASGKLVLTAEDPSVKNTYCQHCEKAVSWTALTEKNLADTSLAAGHYYLDFAEGSEGWVSKSISAQVCLDLNGLNITATNRAFAVKSGGTLSIQGEGTVVGRGMDATLGNTDRVGGAVLVSSGGTLNLYEGTLTFEKVDGQSASNGGVVCVYGTFNMYGGTVCDGTATNAGGNVFVTPTGKLNVYGGVISGGSGKPVYCQGSLLLAGDAQVNAAYLFQKETGPAIDAILTIQGEYTGSIQLEFRDMTYEKGMTIGISDNAQLNHAGISIEGCTLFVAAENGLLKLTDTKTLITRDGYCEVCKKNATWTALMENFSGQTNIESGHYYLDFAGNSGTWNQKTISGMVCLDLNGQTLTGTTRVFLVDGGSVMNLLGDGTVIGRGKASTLDLNDRVGGTIQVDSKAVLNQYGGKLTFEQVSGQSAGNGGILNVNGTYNLYAGSVESGKSNWVGGNIFVTVNGKLNLYGGKVVGGAASQAGNCIACRGSVKLYGDASVTELYLYPNTADGGPALSEMLKIEGKYTGTAKIRASGIKNGMDVGTSLSTDLSDATVTTTSSSVKGLAVHGKDLILLDSSAVVIFDGVTVVQTCSTLAEAVAAYDNEAYKIVLFASVAQDLTLSRDVYVDLNGFDITGAVSGAGTLYCMDAHTDDSTVEDGVYGSVTAGANVKPVPVEAACAEDGYLMNVRDGKASFHCVRMQITGVSLRPAQAGLYYTCEFSGDALVKEMVDTFGLMVSVDADPLQLPEDGIVGKTAMTRETFGSGTAVTSSMVSGIMKTANAEADNIINAATRIYGRAYINFTDGSQMLGDCVARSLREQVCGTEAMYGVERAWDSLSTVQKRSIMDMYTTYDSVVDSWDTPNIANAVQNRDDAGEDVLLERRAQVVAKMRQMGDFYWRATEDVKYRISATGRWVEFKAGRIYRGMPYAHARSDQNAFLEFATSQDEKGIYNIAGITATHMGNGSTYARVGNDCSGSVNFAWSSVGADFSGTNSSRYMIEANGYDKVGDYEYTPTEDGRVGISKEIVAANGKEVMFEAYAKAQPGDALDTTTAAGGHVILVVGKHLVYNPDGSINGEKSYLRTLEQTPGPVSITVQQHSYNEELDEIVYDIYIEKNLTFDRAYSSGYLPITVKVLTDPTPVEEPNVVDSLSAAEHSYENMFKGDLTCSRMISSVNITVTDENGTVFSYTGSGIRASIRKYYMQNFLTEDPAVMRGSLELDKLVAGNAYHCTVKVLLASGDLITVRDFDFVATDVDISIPEGTEPPTVPEEPEDEGDVIPDETTPD